MTSGLETSAHQGDALDGGFADPVFESQAVFRAAMDALAHPGTPRTVDTAVVPPAPLGRIAGALACTLFDHDTAVWLDPAFGKAGIAAWIAFHTSAPLTDDPASAAFALVHDGARMPALNRFAQGSQDYPDRSTTLVIAVSGLDSGLKLALEGPGIRERQTIAPAGLPADFLTQWSDNARRFPRGVDVLLTAPGTIVGLPRTTRIKNAGSV